MRYLVDDFGRIEERIGRMAATAPAGPGDWLAVAPSTASALVAAVNEVIDQRSVEVSFQPLMHLSTAEVVGYEAFARGPEGTLLDSPRVLAEAARLAGRTTELEWLFAAAACRDAMDAHLHPSMTIFLQINPTTLLSRCPPDLRPSMLRARDRLRVVVELTESAMTIDPEQLFDAVGAIRDASWGVAVENAGTASVALALLPVVHPDVVTLDLHSARGNLATIAAMSDGARIYVEETGARILATGIESSDDVLLARFAGADFGQGWHFGGSGSLPLDAPVPRSVFPLLPEPTEDLGATPFEIVASVVEPALTERRFLAALADHLEQQVDTNGPPALLVESFERDVHEDRAMREHLCSLAGRAAFVAILGPDGAGSLGTPMARRGPIAPFDPVELERTVIVLGPHYAVALVARRVDDPVVDQYRRFEYALTHDRSLIRKAARALLHRIRSAQ